MLVGFEPVGKGSLGADLSAEGRYVSAGGSHVIFISDAHLEVETPLAAEETVAIYDRAAGATSASVVSLAPDGSPFAADEGARFSGVSEDGSAVAFEVDETLYLRRGSADLRDRPWTEHVCRHLRGRDAGLLCVGGRV